MKEGESLDLGEPTDDELDPAVLTFELEAVKRLVQECGGIEPFRVERADGDTERPWGLYLATECRYGEPPISQHEHEHLALFAAAQNIKEIVAMRPADRDRTLRESTLLARIAELEPLSLRWKASREEGESLDLGDAILEEAEGGQ